MAFLVFWFVPIASCPLTGYNWCQTPVVFCSTHQVFICMDKILFFSRLNSPSALSLSSYDRCSSPLINSPAFHWTSSSMSMSLSCRAQNWTWNSRCVLPDRQRGRITSPDVLAMLCLFQPRRLLAAVAKRARCWLMVSLSAVAFPTRLLSSWLSLSLHWCLVLFLPGTGLCFLLFSFLMLSLAHFSSLLRPLWVPAQPFGVSVAPLSFVSSANLLRVHSAPSLVKVLNSIGSSIDAWGMPPVSDLHLDFMPLMASLWAWKFSHSTFVHLSSPYFTWFVYEHVMGGSAGSLPEVKIIKIDCSPIIP